jgi:hypothetical protein
MGVVDNNRSKARLIEAVHHLVNKYEELYYFPAYELVIDVLKGLPLYDTDLVHPNYMATEFVLEKFAETFIDASTQRSYERSKKHHDRKKTQGLSTRYDGAQTVSKSLF